MAKPFGRRCRGETRVLLARAAALALWGMPGPPAQPGLRAETPVPRAPVVQLARLEPMAQPGLQVRLVRLAAMAALVRLVPPARLAIPGPLVPRARPVQLALQDKTETLVLPDLMVQQARKEFLVRLARLGQPAQ